MSAKKYSNLTLAELARAIANVKDANKDLAKERVEEYKQYVSNLKEINKEINENNRNLKLLLDREKEAKSKVTIPHPTKFLKWGIRKVGKSFQFGCGEVRINKTQLKSFLKIEAAMDKQWGYETILEAHRSAYAFACRVYNNTTGGAGNVDRYQVRVTEVRGKTKYVFGCGEVALTREEIVLFVRIWSRITPYNSGLENFNKRRKETITMATKLLKSLN